MDDDQPLVTRIRQSRLDAMLVPPEFDDTENETREIVEECRAKLTRDEW